MTRRDTIISAALINAALLVILFVCALGIDESIDSTLHHTHLLPVPLAPREAAQPESQGVQPLHSSTLMAPPSEPPAQILVQKGDRLESLARQYGTSVERLIELNQLSSTQLVAGQQLKLPDPRTEAPKALEQPATSSTVQASQKTPTPSVSIPPKTASPSVPISPKTTPPKPSKSSTTSTSAAEGVQYHYVQKGESPWVIAKKYGLSVDKLLKLNNLDEATARRLREGDRLRVR